ncbi:polysaccharide pyruvyl transferase family protein [Parasporobacterium paucivorans]|uniref:Polysaccharide pyruvyl transferase n=1 Tax=Parasporobacterium paucivorans DSM 15970 TaxID=1122934 RepID=A0A1M6EAA2_9FIRM|nr:polysaccharide pyruvyl transferase family protein [Parasporobacterium paucivorans]SHI82437.1 Polysaccharide pyruvyl transferase [Parasporobacterium paucivorans DSM 15970]
MKIGIVTFHASLNCGSMLQAFALQNILKERYGADVEIVDFSSRGQRQMYSVVDTHLRPRVLKRNLRVFPYRKEIRIMQNDFEIFKGKYFKLTPKFYKSFYQLKELHDRYDLLVAGGDQVWNIRCRDNDMAYFLAFPTAARKISYSPSLGAVNINTAKKNLAQYRKCLMEFSHLSIREPNGKKWLEQLTGREVKIIADPTMLYVPDDWRRLLPVQQIEEKYIFYYAFNYGNKRINKALQEASNKLKMPVYVIERKEWNICGLEKYGFKLWEKADPLAFVNMISNAAYVVTDSFHGTVFSCLFNKQFCNCRHNIVQDKDDDRSSSLLSVLGLESRYVIGEELKAEDLMIPIDYDSVNRMIEDIRKEAFCYLDSAVLEKG